jgi:O-methyltransferase involved in polyketide biosynthesis
MLEGLYEPPVSSSFALFKRSLSRPLIMTSQRINTPSLHQNPTLLKPLIGRLYACYQEFYRSDRILVDHLASRALPEILSDFHGLIDSPPIERVAQLTSVIRSRCFDQAVIAFLEKNPHAVVVNLGARLCTRYSRLPTPHPLWYEVDTREVMEFRKRYFTIVARDCDISCDIRDLSWTSAIQRDEGQSILFILEGQCMYLTPAENQNIFEAIALHFPGAHLLFDTVSPKFLTNDATQAEILSTGEDFLGQWQTPFQSGLASLEDFNSWAIRIRLIQRYDYLLNIASYPERLTGWMRNFWPILGSLLKDSGQIYHLHLASA